MVRACSRGSRVSVAAIVLLVLFLVAAFLRIVLFSGTITPAHADQYGFIMKWGSAGPGDGQFIFPWGVAVDGEGNLYVADSFNHRVQKFTSNGNFITKWGGLGSGDGQFCSPMGVAVDGEGKVYVVDNYNNRVQKFTSSGGFITKWGSSGSGDGQFNYPQGVAVDVSGNVYVADTDNDRVQKFTNDGNFITKWGGWGSGDGQFSFPGGVAADEEGKVYVADTGNDRVQKFTNDGNFITKWGQFSSPAGVAVDGEGNLYVADSFNHRVQKFTNDGNFITKWGSGQFNDPEGVAVDAEGNVYVADTYNHRVQKFRYGRVYTLTIAATAGATTDPLPGTYGYAIEAGVVATVSAKPDQSHVFDHWELDGANAGSMTPIIVAMDKDHSLHAVFVYVPPAPEPPGAPGGDTSKVIAALAFITALYIIITFIIGYFFVPKRKEQTPPDSNFNKPLQDNDSKPRTRQPSVEEMLALEANKRRVL